MALLEGVDRTTLHFLLQPGHLVVERFHHPIISLKLPSDVFRSAWLTYLEEPTLPQNLCSHT